METIIHELVHLPNLFLVFVALIFATGSYVRTRGGGFQPSDLMSEGVQLAALLLTAVAGIAVIVAAVAIDGDAALLLSSILAVCSCARFVFEAVHAGLAKKGDADARSER